MQECPRYNRCNAPLCPLDTNLHRQGGWWTDEAICMNPEFQKYPMIRRQKRLARLTKKRKAAGYEFHSLQKLTETSAKPQKHAQRRRMVKLAL